MPNFQYYIHTLVAVFLARSQYSESPATGHLGTGFSWFPYVYKQILRWFPSLQVVTTCFSCSPPDLNFLDSYFIFTYMHYNHCHRATAHLQLNILYYFMLCYVTFCCFVFFVLCYIVLCYVMLYYIVYCIVLL